VEAELLESHQEEINQLHKKIAEKDDDLKRTAKRYEDIFDVPYFFSLLKCNCNRFHDSVEDFLFFLCKPFVGTLLPKLVLPYCMQIYKASN
jgi:hypothetical protein